MSARPDLLPRYRPMMVADLEAVTAIEQTIYPYPWTHGNFNDSLQAGYHCWIMECAADMVGYGVIMNALNEAHLLNLSVAPAWQRCGLGRAFLDVLIAGARDSGCDQMFLEVRPSNAAGRGLYVAAGFVEIALRRDYYPAPSGREDAIIMELDL